MTLYEYMKIHQNDIDTGDNVFDATVTICYIEDDDYKRYPDDENYYKFCLEIQKKVDVIEANKDYLVINWYEVIKRNMEKFKAFTRKNWYDACQYEDDEDEFIYQWINEIHSYLAGYGDEELYKELVDIVENLN